MHHHRPRHCSVPGVLSTSEDPKCHFVYTNGQSSIFKRARHCDSVDVNNTYAPFDQGTLALALHSLEITKVREIAFEGVMTTPSAGQSGDCLAGGAGFIPKSVLRGPASPSNQGGNSSAKPTRHWRLTAAAS